MYSYIFFSLYLGLLITDFPFCDCHFCIAGVCGPGAGSEHNALVSGGRSQGIRGGTGTGIRTGIVQLEIHVNYRSRMGTVRVTMRVSRRNTLRRPVGRVMTISCYRRRTGRRSVHLITSLICYTGVGTCAFHYL